MAKIRTPYKNRPEQTPGDYSVPVGESDGKKDEKKPIVLKESVSDRTVTGTVIFLAGLFFAFLTVVRGSQGTLWYRLHYYYFALNGLTGIILPAAALVIGVLVLLGRFEKRYIKVAVGVYSFFLIISMICFVGGLMRNAGRIGFFSAAADAFRVIDGETGKGRFNAAGLVGTAPGTLIYNISARRFLSVCILSVLLIADVLLVFGSNLRLLFEKLEPFAKAGAGKAKEEIGRKRDSIREKNREKKAENKKGASAENDGAPGLITDYYGEPSEAEAVETLNEINGIFGSLTGDISSRRAGDAEEKSCPPAVSDEDEELIFRALGMIAGAPENATAAALQKNLSLGFSKACRILGILEERGFVGPDRGRAPREVLLSYEDYKKMRDCRFAGGHG